MVWDITRQWEAEQQLRRSLQEKELLLREVHHRVKNNLQVITGLLDIFGQRSGDPGTIRTCHDIRSKVFAMATIHSQLYQHPEFSRVELGAIVREIFQHLRGLHDPQGESTDLALEGPEVFLPLTQAVPCAMALNESLSNSFRHAFRPGRERRIGVTLELLTAERLRIMVSDSGCGLPEDLNLQDSGTFGLELARNLVEYQLAGSFCLGRGHGARVTMEFAIREEHGLSARTADSSARYEG